MYGTQERLLKGATFAMALVIGAASIVVLTGYSDTSRIDAVVIARSAPAGSPASPAAPVTQSLQGARIVTPLGR